MKSGESIVCPHCRERSVAREKKRMKDWTIASVHLVCSFCGGDLGEPESAEVAESRAVREASQRLASLLGEGARMAPKADLSGEETGCFCHNCAHFVAHPFQTLCGKKNCPTDPMGDCSDFEKKG